MTVREAIDRYKNTMPPGSLGTVAGYREAARILIDIIQERTEKDKAITEMIVASELDYIMCARYEREHE